MGSDSSLKKAIPSKSHRERQQPLWRIKQRHVGPLEKRKDYVVRARKHHQVENQRQLLKEKIANKNELEYTIDMANSKKNTKTGVTTVYKLPVPKMLPHEEADDQTRDNLIKEARTATKHKQAQFLKQNASLNLNLLRTRLSVELKQIEKLKKDLSFLAAATDVTNKGRNNDEDEDEERHIELEENPKKQKKEAKASTSNADESDDEDDDDEDEETEDAFRVKHTKKSKGKERQEALPKGRHIVFVDNEEQLDSFDPQKYFDTDPALASNIFNRPRQETLAKFKLDKRALEETSTSAMDRAMLKQYEQLEEHLQKAKTLKKAIRDVELALSITAERDSVAQLVREKTDDVKRSSNFVSELKSVVAVKFKNERKR